MNLLQKIEQQQLDRLKAVTKIVEFDIGDTVRVNVKVVEGTRERVQSFEGVCIARRNASINSAFTVRKISYSEGVERVFPLYSPVIESIVAFVAARCGVQSFITCASCAGILRA